MLTVEVNEKGELNVPHFVESFTHRFRKFALRKKKIIQFITHYELEKLAIRRGTLQWVDQRTDERDWTWGSITFSLARIVYPEDPQEALPTGVYLNATVQGELEGQILVIGRFNPFAQKKSFDVTGSAKNILLSEYNYFFPSFPLAFRSGRLQLRAKALCHDNQVDLYHLVTIDNLRFAPKTPASQGQSEAFGLPPETVANFFNQMWRIIKAPVSNGRN